MINGYTDLWGSHKKAEAILEKFQNVNCPKDFQISTGFSYFKLL